MTGEWQDSARGKEWVAATAAPGTFQSGHNRPLPNRITNESGW